jgi:hypothetical protein
MRPLFALALVAALALALLVSGSGVGQDSQGAIIEKRVEQGTLPAGQAGYILLRCSRGYVATAGGYATSLPALVPVASVIDRRQFAVVVYNTLQVDPIVVQGRAVCIQGTVVRTVVARASSTADLFQSALEGARRKGYEVVRLGD